MAKRLSKALRGKRRWFGVAFSDLHKSRKDVELVLQSMKLDKNLTKKLRLMDFHISTKELSVHLTKNLDFELPVDVPLGFGIIEVSLEDSNTFRELLSESLLSKYGMKSLTMSGKIRLVRERLKLPKPERKK